MSPLASQLLLWVLVFFAGRWTLRKLSEGADATVERALRDCELWERELDD